MNKIVKKKLFYFLCTSLLLMNAVQAKGFNEIENINLVKDFQKSEKETLPPIIEGKTDKDYKQLGTVGISDKDILRARESLRREAKKMSADAIIEVICTPERIRRQGLTWSHEPPYCKGVAIAYQ
ncbi:MAG: hypothetical protein H7A32_03190 [Deltaproteobacteria bacterium]|nr:hypothetical protein [Deltaproteobacteria bacterium]